MHDPNSFEHFILNQNIIFNKNSYVKENQHR